MKSLPHGSHVVYNILPEHATLLAMCERGKGNIFHFATAPFSVNCHHLSLNAANFATMLAFSKSKCSNLSYVRAAINAFSFLLGNYSKEPFLWLSDFSGNGTQILNLKQIILSNCINQYESSICKRKKQCFYLFLDPHPHLGPPPNVEHCFIVFFCIIVNFWWIYLHINLWPHFYFFSFTAKFWSKSLDILRALAISVGLWLNAI